MSRGEAASGHWPQRTEKVEFETRENDQAETDSRPLTDCISGTLIPRDTAVRVNDDAGHQVTSRTTVTSWGWSRHGAADAGTTEGWQGSPAPRCL